MSYPVGFHPGAVWRKTDLQVHTPRDAQWNGDSFDSNSEVGREGRLAWARDLTRKIHGGLADIAQVADTA